MLILNKKIKIERFTNYFCLSINQILKGLIISKIFGLSAKFQSNFSEFELKIKMKFELIKLIEYI